jgi:hypothetical protein
VKIVAADRGKKYKTQQSAGWESIREKAARLPDHHCRADRDVETAENDVIDYFSQHDVFRL